MATSALTEYKLRSTATGTIRPDRDGWTLSFADESPPALIRSMYTCRKLTIREDLPGLYRYADWLPIRRILTGSAPPVSYHSEGLGPALGLDNLWITFNGWWPEKGAGMKSGSFKECEAYSVCARMDDETDKVLVVASAGNTARAFAGVCSDNGIPLLLFVPEDNLSALWFDKPLDPCVKLICPEGGGDYFDAIRMSRAAGGDGFLQEGGAANVARRDGMGTTVLSAATAMGRIPDMYFQAVGSGTGAIAAWEANLRLLADGRYGDTSMRLIVSQNAPFVPIADSWRARSRDFLVAEDAEARSLASRVNAKVLTNRRPPWGLAGGLFDALKATEGAVLTAANEEADRAAERFLELEGCDLSPAAAVATASLFKAVEQGLLNANTAVMLNITGGGVELFKSSHELHTLEPSAVLPLGISDEEIAAVAEGLF